MDIKTIIIVICIIIILFTFEVEKTEDGITISFGLVQYIKNILKKRKRK